MRRYAIIGILVFLAVQAGCATNGPAPDEYMEMSKDSEPPAISYPQDETPGRDDMVLGVKDPNDVWSLRRVKYSDILKLMEDGDIPATIARISEIPASIDIDQEPVQGATDSAMSSDWADRQSVLDRIDNLVVVKDKKATVIAGEDFSSDDYRMPYYLKSVSGVQYAYKYRAGVEYPDNRNHVPSGIICDEALPVSAGEGIDVTVGSWGFRDDSLGITSGEVGHRLYVGKSGGWTSMASELADDGDLLIDYGIIRKVVPTIVELNQFVMVYERQADGSAAFFSPIPSLTPPEIETVAFSEDGTKLILTANTELDQGENYTDGAWELAYTDQWNGEYVFLPNYHSGGESAVWTLNAGTTAADHGLDSATLKFTPVQENEVESSVGGIDLDLFTKTVDFSAVDLSALSDLIFVAGSIDTAGTTLTLTFNKEAQQGTGYNDSDFTLLVDGSVVGLTYTSGNESAQHVYTLSSAASHGESATISFNGDTDSLERVDNGSDLGALTNASITNNSTQGQSTQDTQYFYMQVSGAGGNLDDTGVWAVLPTSASNAMSLANFNNSDNWEPTENTQNSSKIDFDDVVYVMGSGWDRGLYIKPQGGVTLDGDESGTCDAIINTDCPDSTTINGATILVQVDNVTIRDFDFTNVRYGGVVATRDLVNTPFTQEAVKVSNLIIEHNRFDIANDQTALILHFVPDAIIRYNHAEGPERDCVYPEPVSSDDFISLNAGSRIKVLNNRIINLHHTFYMQPSLDVNYNDTIDYPGSGSYKIDPDVNFRDIEIAYNEFGERCAEGVSWDGSDSNATSQNVDVDEITNIAGNVVTLAGGDWDDYGDHFSGLYMVSYDTTDMSKYGTVSIIESQADNVFTLADATGFTVGQEVAIGMINQRMWIHHNRFLQKHRGYGSTFYLEDLSNRCLIENNFVYPRDYSEGHGVSMLSKRQYKPNYNATNTFPTFQIIKNVIRYNTLDWLLIGAGCQPPACPTSSADADPHYANSVYDNLLYDDVSGYYDRTVQISKGTVYAVDNNWIGKTTTGSIYQLTNSGVRNTTTDWAASTPSAVYASHPPNILKTEVSGTSLTVTFTESVTGCSAGNCGFSVTKDGNPVTLSHTGGTGATRTFALGSTLSGSSYLFYDGTGVIEDGDGNAMYKWSTVGHDLMTEY